MTTPATAEQLAAEVKRLDALGLDFHHELDQLAAMAKAAEGANASAQQSGEAVAWRWIPSAVWGEYVIVGDKAHAERAAALGMKVEPLYPQQAALTEGDVSAGYSRADCDYDCYMAFECGVRFAEEKHGIGGAR